MTEPDRLQQIETALKESIGKHFPNCQFLAAFLVALLAVCKVTLHQIGDALPGSQSAESGRQRILYFLKHARLPDEAFAKAMAALIPFPKPWVLAIDRTDWKLGKTSINLMSLCVCYRGMGFSLLWMPLPKGPSNQAQRIALMNRYLKLFGHESIAFLTADREFIGAEWLAWLHQEKISFRIRIRRDNLLALPGGDKIAPDLLIRRKTRCRKHALALWGVSVFVGGKPLKRGEHLCIISNVYTDVMSDYRERWSIECLFQALKSRGFDLEATHLTDDFRLCRLLGLLSLALIWSYRTGEWLYEQPASSDQKPSRLKKHGRPARSVLQAGLVFLRRLLLPLSGRFDKDDFGSALRTLGKLSTA